ncbi:DUF493 family protein [Buchnera aphidicola]|uniref:DUF493 family protein n=1 Tax=Buchnera aphidicola TaxID=9 RepID=UPI0030EBDA5A
MFNKLKKLIKVPCYFNFKIIGYNKNNIKKKILKLIKKKKIKKFNIKKKNSYKNKYISFSVTIYIKKFKNIIYFYKNFKKIYNVKIVL